ncbi:MAG: hypothetical protein ACRD9L_27810, partial [Bryobacteraceae bacterium]
DLKGIDDVYLIVPMNREFNQTGKWRKMERAIGELMATPAVPQTAVDGTVVSPIASASPVSLTLTSKTVLNSNWWIEILVYYDDTIGADPRIPVWFYVQVFRNKQLITHFSLGNRCGKRALMPNKNEVLEYLAAKAAYKKLWEGKKIDNVLSPEYFAKYKEPDSAIPPNQLLQFMHDVNSLAISKTGQKVFLQFDQVTIGKSTAYNMFQRIVFKKFNRWKNNAELKSDVQTKDLYEGEDADLYSILGECGGRNAPEIDHIDPSYQSGQNSYINGRLVSFYHNHIYREKKTTGALEVNVELRKRFQAGALKFISGDDTLCWESGAPKVVSAPPVRTSSRVRRDSVKLSPMQSASAQTYKSPGSRDFPFTIRTKQDASGLLNPVVLDVFLSNHFADAVLFNGAPEWGLSAKAKATIKGDEETLRAWPYDDPTVWELVDARQKFLIADEKRKAKLLIEALLENKYRQTAANFDAGVQNFIDNAAHPGRQALLAIIKAAGIPLCKPSDILKPNGGMDGADAADEFPVVDPLTVEAEPTYKNVFLAAKAAGLAL